MVRALRLLALGLLCLLGTVPPRALALQAIPKLEARVTDLTGTLTAGEQADLEAKLKAFQERKGSQIAVLLVPSTQPEAIEQYSIRVVEAWKLGREKPDDGVLLLVAKDDRSLRIEVGRGLEGALTDATSNRIIDETITPLFKQGQFAAGINAGVAQIIQVVDGEALPPPDSGWKGGGGALWNALPALFIGYLVVSGILRAIFGRLGGAAGRGQLPVPPIVIRSIRSVGWPTPTGTPWPFLPQVPMPWSRARSLPIMVMRFKSVGPLPISIAPLTGAPTLPFSIR